MRQFEVSAGGSVDLDVLVCELTHWRAQQGQFALLRDVEVVDQRAHGRQFRALKRAEPVQR